MSDRRPLLRLGHSPDPDDAFMWWPLLEAGERRAGEMGGRPAAIETDFRFTQVLDDIESLNRRSEAAELEITAISCAQYPFVRDRYAITACGASMGENYGPKLVARRPMQLEELADSQIVLAVPGERTSAFAVASLMLGPGRFRHQVVPFDQIIARVKSGEFEAGLVIHEGQLTFARDGLFLIEDLGGWWFRRCGLSLPLGLNVIRRDLEDQHGRGTLARITAALQQSINYALSHRLEGIERAMTFARDMRADQADRFISLYVNRLTVDMGEAGRRAVRTFLAELHAAGLTPEAGEVDIISPAPHTRA